MSREHNPEHNSEDNTEHNPQHNPEDNTEHNPKRSDKYKIDRLRALLRFHNHYGLWDKYIPHECVTILHGDHLIGKTHLCAELAYRYTRDVGFPDGSIGFHGDAIFLCGSPSITPKWVQQMSQFPSIHVLTNFYFFEKDIQRLLVLISKSKHPIVFVDDIGSTFTTAKIASRLSYATFIKTYMVMLERIAKNYGATFVLIHTTSPEHQLRIDKEPGWSEISTSNLYMVRDPLDERYVLLACPSRISSLTSERTPTLRFRFEPDYDSHKLYPFVWDKQPDSRTGIEVETYFKSRKRKRSQ